MSRDSDYWYDPDDFIWDYRDRPERPIDYNRDPPPRPTPHPPDPRPTGPSPWDLIQQAQADAQMAAYLATNPDPRTGLPRISQEEETRNGMTQAEWYANQAKMDVINDPSVKMTVSEKNAINDPKKVMTPAGKIVKRKRIIYPPVRTKRTRKKTKMDRTLSKCLKMANARYRKKNGQLKKGKSMRDVMKLAHRLCKKHG